MSLYIRAPTYFGIYAVVFTVNENVSIDAGIFQQFANWPLHVRKMLCNQRCELYFHIQFSMRMQLIYKRR